MKGFPPAAGRIGFVAIWLGWMLWAASVAQGSDFANRPAVERGILRLARISDPQTVDPAMLTSAEDFLLFYVLHQPLLDITNNDQVINNLTTRFETSGGGLVWTFHLRPDVRFSNGRPVVAEDYAFSMQRFLEPAVHAPGQSYLLGIRGAADVASGKTNRVAGIRTPDPLTLVVELTDPDPTFPFVLTSVQGVPLARETIVDPLKDCGFRVAGVSPYRVVEWTRGARMSLRRDPSYTDPHRQLLEGIDILIGGDEVTHMMMFERGEIDIANISGIGIPVPDRPRLRRDPRWSGRIESIPLFNTTFVNLNTEMEPFKDVRVRRAMNYAFNRERWASLTPGDYTPIRGVIPPLMKGTFNAGLRGYDYDPDRARRLLREAGLPNGFKTTLWHLFDQRISRLALALQADLAAVGVEVELHPATTTVIWDAIGNRRMAPMSISGWNVTIPDPKDSLGLLLHSRSITDSGSMNQAFYSNPAVDQLLDEASKTFEPATRAALYRKAEERVVEDAPWIFQGSMNLFCLRQPWVKGPLMDAVAWYRFDRVWIER